MAKYSVEEISEVLGNMRVADVPKFVEEMIEKYGTAIAKNPEAVQVLLQSGITLPAYMLPQAKPVESKTKVSATPVKDIKLEWYDVWFLQGKDDRSTMWAVMDARECDGEEAKRIINNVPVILAKRVSKEKAESVLAPFQRYMSDAKLKVVPHGQTPPEVEKVSRQLEATSYDVILKAVNLNYKIATTRLIRDRCGMSLQDAMFLINEVVVEGTPMPLRRGISGEEAEELKTEFESLGAEVELRPSDAF